MTIKFFDRWFNVMVKDIQNVSWYRKHGLTNTPQSRLGISHLNLWKNRGFFVVTCSTFHQNWGPMFYLLQPIWTWKNMAIGHLPTHVPTVNSWFKRHAKTYTLGRLMWDTIIFTKYFEGGLTQGPTSMNLVVTHTTFWYDSMGDVIR